MFKDFSPSGGGSIIHHLEFRVRFLYTPSHSCSCRSPMGLAIESRFDPLWVVRRVEQSDSGLWWADWHEAGETGVPETQCLFDSNDKGWSVDVIPAPLTAYAPFTPDIRLVRLGDVLLPEDFYIGNVHKVRTTPLWEDRPVFVGERDGSLVLLDGATRTGWLSMRLGLQAGEQIVPVQVVDPLYLTLDTWLSRDQRLTIEDVWQHVASGRKVLPKQTRFGVEIRGVCYSVAETQPLVRFHEPILTFLPR